MHNNGLIKTRKQTGSILILVLIVIASLAAVALSLAYRCQIELKLAGSSSRRIQTYYLAYGGIQRCMALLSQQKMEPKAALFLGSFSSSAQQDGLFDTIGLDSEVGPSLVYWITDESGCISINHSDPSFWENTGLLDRSQVACIIDWIDADDDTNPEGAETGYYERIAIATQSKNAPVLSLKELLNVKGISAGQYSLLYSPALSAIDNNVESAVLLDEVIQQSSRTIHHYFSTGADGKININTVPFDIIAILPGLSESTANSLMTHRAGQDRKPGTEDDGCVENAGDIAKIEGLTELEVELLGQYCRFDSDSFRIYSCAKNSNHIILLTASVRIIEDKPMIVSVERLL